MCNKKERKRDRRWYLFPVSTLGAVYFAVHGGTGRFGFFFEAGRGVFFFFDGTGRGGVFFFFRGPGRDGCFRRWQFFWRDGAKSLHRPTKGGLNRPASRPCKALVFFFEEVLLGESALQTRHLTFARWAAILSPACFERSRIRRSSSAPVNTITAPQSLQ